MQKVTAFLEQHIQWVAIGLGALFCLYMTWSYVITPPAEVTIGNDTFGPSEIDPHTADTVAAKLSSAMTGSGRIRIDVPQYVQGFNETMTWKNAKPIEIAEMTDPALKLEVTAPAPPQQLGPDGKPIPTATANNTVPGATTPGVTTPGGTVNKLTALPLPPKPAYDPENGLKYGRSVVIPLPGPGQPAPAVTPGVIPPGAIDTDWVTQMWTVSMPQLDAAWQKAGLNNPALQGLNTTVFLNVEMVREEQIDGKWQNETVIQPLDVTRNNQPRMPYPPSGVANKGQQFAYIIWAAQNTADIIQPLFHNTVPGKGDQWTKPGAQVMTAMQFNPAAHVGGKGALTEEQWQQVLQYRRDQYKLQLEQKNQNRGTPRGPTGGGRGGPAEMMEGGGNYAPARDRRSYAPIRAEQLPHYAPAPGRGPGGAPVYPPRNPYGPYGGSPEMMDGGEGGFGGYGGAPQAPGLPVPGTDFPTGEFNPSDPMNPPPLWKTKDVELWAHDPTVQAGKVYRYKMRYMLKNPIFGAGNVANPPTLSDEFAIASEWSDWTTQITVPSLVNFFVAGGGIARKTVAFEIFRWDQGQQKAERFDLAPGDPVGWAKNGIDFGTDWTVVDFREDPRTNDPQILLLNNTDGRVIARSFGADRNDKLYNALKKQVSDAKAAETAAAGGPAASAAGGAVGR